MSWTALHAEVLREFGLLDGGARLEQAIESHLIWMREHVREYQHEYLHDPFNKRRLKQRHRRERQEMKAQRRGAAVAAIAPVGRPAWMDERFEQLNAYRKEGRSGAQPERNRRKHQLERERDLRLVEARSPSPLPPPVGRPAWMEERFARLNGWRQQKPAASAREDGNKESVLGEASYLESSQQRKGGMKK